MDTRTLQPASWFCFFLLVLLEMHCHLWRLGQVPSVLQRVDWRFFWVCQNSLFRSLIRHEHQGVQKEPSSVVRGAIVSILATEKNWCFDLGVCPCCGYFKVGPSDKVRDRPRKFPHPGHGHEWRRLLFFSSQNFGWTSKPFRTPRNKMWWLWTFDTCLSISFNHITIIVKTFSKTWRSGASRLVHPPCPGE